MIERKRVKAIYIGTKPKKGFRGNWTMTYLFKDMQDEDGTMIMDSFTLNNCKCIRGKHFRNGDIISLNVNLEYTSNKIKVTYPSDAIKIGHATELYEE